MVEVYPRFSNSAFTQIAEVIGVTGLALLTVARKGLRLMDSDSLD
jgi:hypothetical protein